MAKHGEVVPDFRIVGGPNSVEGIRCEHCGRTSYHPDDVAKRRCPFENRFLVPRPEDDEGRP